MRLKRSFLDAKWESENRKRQRWKCVFFKSTKEHTVGRTWCETGNEAFRLCEVARAVRSAALSSEFVKLWASIEYSGIKFGVWNSTAVTAVTGAFQIYTSLLCLKNRNSIIKRRFAFFGSQSKSEAFETDKLPGGRQNEKQIVEQVGHFSASQLVASG